MTVPIGPLDNAAFVQTVDGGIPGPSVAIPVEVKNLRDWLYPTNAELYQLLAKASMLQQERPDVPMVPLLIARRMHITTFRLFKDIGAYAIQTLRQYIGAVEGGDQRLNEVRAGLGLLDLSNLGSKDDDLVTNRLIRIVPRDALRVSKQWAITASNDYMVKTFDLLRKESRVRTRVELVDKVREMLDDDGRYSGGW